MSSHNAASASPAACTSHGRGEAVFPSHTPLASMTTASLATMTAASLATMTAASLATMTGDALDAADAFDAADSASAEKSDGSAHSYGPDASDASMYAREGRDDEDSEAMDDGDISQVVADLGFDGCETGELLPAPGFPHGMQRPLKVPAHRNLFWRQFTASREPPLVLTAERLAAHRMAQDDSSDMLGVSVGSGDWLWNFKVLARMVPVAIVVSQTVLGRDMSAEVTAFAMGLEDRASLSEIPLTNAAPDAIPDGSIVFGSKTQRLAAGIIGGRGAFIVEDDDSIITPTCSSVWSG